MDKQAVIIKKRQIIVIEKIDCNRILKEQTSKIYF